MQQPSWLASRCMRLTLYPPVSLIKDLLKDKHFPAVPVMIYLHIFIPPGCDTTTGICRTSLPVEEKGISTSSKILLTILVIVLCAIITPVIYAMYKLKQERNERALRLQENMELARQSLSAYQGENST